ncbi:hypothetical protein B0H21DRAFT_857251 [Amylocystis lapponica]|nr:hypothetical protein B0H21DRAFT_857251 [Amylocystis lapponica]
MAQCSDMHRPPSSTDEQHGRYQFAFALSTIMLPGRDGYVSEKPVVNKCASSGDDTPISLLCPTPSTISRLEIEWLFAHAPTRTRHEEGPAEDATILCEMRENRRIPEDPATSQKRPEKRAKMTTTVSVPMSVPRRQHTKNVGRLIGLENTGAHPMQLHLVFLLLAQTTPQDDLYPYYLPALLEPTSASAHWIAVSYLSRKPK